MNTMIIDPVVKLFDTKNWKLQSSVDFLSGSSFIMFHPKLSNNFIFGSTSGAFQMVDLCKPGITQIYQVNALGYCAASDLSSSGEALAFGDIHGVIHLWSTNDQPNFNQNSRATHVPIPFNALNSIHLDNHSPLNSIGMPYYTELLLSAFPNMIVPITKCSDNIPKDILDSVKITDFIGYAPNKLHHKRHLVKCETDKVSDGPKFRSEQQREKVPRTPSKMNLRALSSSPEPVKQILSITKYRKVEIKYSKFGIEDFDFNYFNKTQYGGLETHIEHSYLNSMLQLLFFTPTFKLICQAHIKVHCEQDHCMTCEFGFLSRMLDDAKGQNCQASNLLRTFPQIPQAKALFLFETPDIQQNYTTLIQTCLRFMLEQVHQETSKFLEKQSIQDLLGFKIESFNVCTLNHCQSEKKHIFELFTITLTCSSKSKFLQALEEYLQTKVSVKTWCEGCKEYTLSHSTKKMIELPDQLFINIQNNNHSWKNCQLYNKIYFGKDVHSVSSDKVDDSICYELVVITISNRSLIRQATIDSITFDSKSHLVSHIKTDQGWILFNDFLVENIDETSVLNYENWRAPCVIQYKRFDRCEVPKIPLKNDAINLNVFSTKLLNQRNKIGLRYSPLTLEEIPIKKGTLCAIDTEFVLLVKEESEIRSDGTRLILRPSRMSLARVSVLRCTEGSNDYVPFIDEYISTIDPIVDYLTEFSGIKVGDLDRQYSKNPLVSLKSSYKKLRSLIDVGCIFVGHGLKKDFRILSIIKSSLQVGNLIDLIVPSDQVIDTVDLFFLKHKSRKLSLRFLAYALLKKEIQQDSHDSIEDAKTAYDLYKLYLNLLKFGTFNQVLESLYEDGKALSFKPPTPKSVSQSHFDSSSYSYQSPVKEKKRVSTTRLFSDLSIVDSNH